MQDQNATTPRDNLLGVCHAIGDAFGFNPLLLRIAFAVGLLFDSRPRSGLMPRSASQCLRPA